MQSAIAFSLGEPAGDALLKEALTRYRRLTWSLRLPGWRRSICRNGEALRGLFGQDEALQAVLRTLPTRESQGWPKALLARARCVVEERHALKRLAARRLHEERELSVLALLKRLEQEAFRSAAPRLERRGMWEWSNALIPQDLAEVREAARTAQVLEGFFLRPNRPGPFPWLPDETVLIAQALPEAEAAVGALWQRLDALEPTQRLRRALERFAKGKPRRPIRSGPAILVHADFWLRTARAKLTCAIRQALTSPPLGPSEVLPVMVWLSRRTLAQKEHLAGQSGLSESRAALFEFIAAWQDVENAPHKAQGWWWLEECGRRLDGCGSALSRELGREPLRRFIRLRGMSRAVLPLDASVVGWVRTAWALSSASPAGDKVRGPWRHSVAGFG